MLRSNVVRVVAAAAIAFFFQGLAVAQDTPAAVPAAVPAPVTPAALELYGRLPAFGSPKISPDGQKLAYLVTVGEARSMLIMNLSDLSIVGGVREIENKVRSIDWVGNNHILITTSTTTAIASLGMGQSELTQGIIYRLADRGVSTIFARNTDLLRILAGAPIIRETPTGPAVFVEGFTLEDYSTSLYRIDPDTGRGRAATGDERGVQRYLLTATGELAARAVYEGEQSNWGLEAARGGLWPRLWTTRAPLDQPSLIGFGRTERSVILLAKKEGEEEERYHEVSLDTGEWADLTFARAKPDFLIYHPATKLLIGAGWTGDDGPEYEFTDPVAGRSWRSINAAFRDRNVSLASWSSNLRTVVVNTNGPGDSGTYHLVDFERGVAEIVGQSYPSISAAQVGDIRFVTYTAADGMEIPGYLTLPPGVTEPRNLPLVVLPHGGPAARDAFGFDWWAQALAARGYVVLQPNFRGSDGLGAAHLEAGYGQWGRKMQTDLSDGVRWLAGQGMIDPARVCIVGASYGGYAAMAGPTIDPGVYRCAVSVAGVSDLRRMVDWSGQQAGLRNSPAVRYWTRFMGAGQLDEISPAFLAARADAPILLIHGGDDTVVPYEQSTRFADALRRAGKPHQLIRLDGEDHWLSSQATRQRMLEETVRFLEMHNPPN